MDKKLELNTSCIICGSENTVEDEDVWWYDKYLEGSEVPLWCVDCKKFTTIVTYSSPEVDSKEHYQD